MNKRSCMALIGATIALAGCGSSSDTASTGDSPSSSPAVTKVQFIAKADTICQRLNEEFAAAKANSQDIHEIVRLAPHRAVLEQRTVSELTRLTPPSTIAAALRQIIAYRRTLAQELAELASVARRGDSKAVAVLAASKAKMHAKLHAVATSAGFESCGLVG
jgi:hypothetical protein